MPANITTLSTHPFAEPGFTQSETQENATNNSQELGTSAMRQRLLSGFVSNTITDEPVYKSSVFSVQVKE